MSAEMSADKNDDDTTKIANDETHIPRFVMHSRGAMSAVHYVGAIYAVLENTVSFTTRWVDRDRLRHKG